MNTKFGFNGFAARPCKASNAYCRMCHHNWQTGIQNPIPKGEMVLEVKLDTAAGAKTSLICKKHAQELFACLQEEMNKLV